LQVDENLLGVILALANLSQEKFLRVLSAERFAQGDYAPEWGIDRVHTKLKRDPSFAERVASLFIEGQNSPLLKHNVAGFYLDQLRLPENWWQLIRDETLIRNVIRRKLSGEYIDRKGDAIETLIRSVLNQIQEQYGVSHSKGQVQLVGKEIDHTIPSTADPFVMMMTSYMETTSSSQTTRANEQREMYLKIQSENIRYGIKRVFVNFVDGAGWLARRSDLRKMYDGCDYILNLKTLDQLASIICKYVPASYFAGGIKPAVEG
jgi:hypothetical protein